MHHVVSEERLATGGHSAKQEVSDTVKATDVWVTIAGIPIEDALAAIMKPGSDDERRYGDSRMATMVQGMVDSEVSAKCESVNFEVPLRRTIHNILLSPRCLVKVTEALLEADEFLEPVAHMVRTKADRAIKASSKRG